MKVFISGPMSGKPYHNNAAFFKAQDDLERHGYSVWNPAWLAYPNNTEFSKDDMHKIDFAALELCDAIYMLKDWRYSNGAKAEYDYACTHGKTIMYEGVHLWGKEPEKKRYNYGFNNRKYDNHMLYASAVKHDRAEIDRLLESMRMSNEILPLRDRVSELEEKVNNIDICSDCVDNHTDRIDILEEQIEDIYDTSYRHGENIDLCLCEINLIEKKYKDLAEDVEDCKKEDERIDIIFGNHADKINSLDSEVEAIKESIGTDDLQGQLDKDFKDVYNEFQSVKDMVNDINFGYIDWSSKMSSAIEDIEETRKHVMSFYDGEFIDTFNKVDERLKKLEKTVNGLNSIVGTLGERLEEIENFVADCRLSEPKSKGKKA